MLTSKFLSVDVKDFLHGLAAAAAASVVPVIGQSIENGSFVFNFTDIWHAALAGAWAYVTVRFFSKRKQVLPIE